MTPPDRATDTNPRGMASHRRGDECHVLTIARQARAAGLERTRGDYRWLHGLGLTRDLYTNLQRGGPGRRNKVKTQPWTLTVLLEALRDGRASKESISTTADSLRRVLHAYQPPTLD